MFKGVKEPSYRKRPAYHSFLLGGMALLVSALVVIGDLETKDVIETRLAEDLRQSLAQVVPAALHDNNLLDDVVLLKTDQTSLFDSQEVKVYRAFQQHEIVAVAFEVVGQGYAGPIRMILGIDRDEKILGVRVVAHAETPGLGDKIEAKKSDWINKFNGLSFAKLKPAKWAVKKDGGEFDQFSGATITPRATVKAIKAGLAFFKTHKQELLAANQLTASVQH